MRKINYIAISLCVAFGGFSFLTPRPKCQEMTFVVCMNCSCFDHSFGVNGFYLHYDGIIWNSRIDVIHAFWETFIEMLHKHSPICCRPHLARS